MTGDVLTGDMIPQNIVLGQQFFSLLANNVPSVIILVLAFFWIVALVRVARDANARYTNIRGFVVAIALVLFLTPIFGLPLYISLRPVKYRWSQEKRILSVCPQCSCNIDPIHSYCSACGGSIQHLCTHCHKLYCISDLYCHHCGTASISSSKKGKSRTSKKILATDASSDDSAASSDTVSSSHHSKKHV